MTALWFDEAAYRHFILLRSPEIAQQANFIQLAM
jgi:hypothetical protein